MNIKDFDYELPKELIAQKPNNPRDCSRLLILNKETGEIKHNYFYQIINHLKKGDVLVLNNTKVFPARLIGKKAQTAGKVEVFLHQYVEKKSWNCLVGGKNVKPGLKVFFERTLECTIIKNNNNGTWIVEFNKEKKEMMAIVKKIGLTPLPPYIKRDNKKVKDKIDYQTVYAHNRKNGSVAAPTAGLHFTAELLKKIKDKGIKIEYITLHVGLGTFSPIKVDNIKDHKMHFEKVEVRKEVIETIIKAKRNKKRIIAVGTTSVRAIESVVAKNIGKKNFEDKSEYTDIFIYPGYKVKIIDGMITNFHLPKSSLLLLVSALAGKNNIKKAYKEAIKNNYRFYSYGDAMFIY